MISLFDFIVDLKLNGARKLQVEKNILDGRKGKTKSTKNQRAETSPLLKQDSIFIAMLICPNNMFHMVRITMIVESQKLCFFKLE